MINDVMKILLKINFGNETYDFEYLIDSVILIETNTITKFFKTFPKIYYTFV